MLSIESTKSPQIKKIPNNEIIISKKITQLRQ